MKKTKLTRFEKEYLSTAFWSSIDEESNPLDCGYSYENLTEDSVLSGKKDCESFIKDCGDLIDGLDLDQVAHDFWLTRNGHGSGFWDGEKLTLLAKKYKECNLYILKNGTIEVY